MRRKASAGLEPSIKKGYKRCRSEQHQKKVNGRRKRKGAQHPDPGSTTSLDFETPPSSPPTVTAGASPVNRRRPSPWAVSPSRETAGGVLVKENFYHGFGGRDGSAGSKSDDFRSQIGGKNRLRQPRAWRETRRKSGSSTKAREDSSSNCQRRARKLKDSNLSGTRGGVKFDGTPTERMDVSSFHDRLRYTPLSQGAWVLDTEVEHEHGSRSVGASVEATQPPFGGAQKCDVTRRHTQGSSDPLRRARSGDSPGAWKPAMGHDQLPPGVREPGGRIAEIEDVGAPRASIRGAFREVRLTHDAVMADLRGEIDPLTREEIVLRAAEDARRALARAQGPLASPSRASDARVGGRGPENRRDVPDQIDYEHVEATMSLIELAACAAGPDAGRQMLKALEALQRIHQGAKAIEPRRTEQGGGSASPPATACSDRSWGEQESNPVRGLFQAIACWISRGIAWKKSSPGAGGHGVVHLIEGAGLRYCERRTQQRLQSAGQQNRQASETMTQGPERDPGRDESLSVPNDSEASTRQSSTGDSEDLPEGPLGNAAGGAPSRAVNPQGRPLPTPLASPASLRQRRSDHTDPSHELDGPLGSSLVCQPPSVNHERVARHSGWGRSPPKRPTRTTSKGRDGRSSGWDEGDRRRRDHGAGGERPHQAERIGRRSERAAGAEARGSGAARCNPSRAQGGQATGAPGERSTKEPQTPGDARKRLRLRIAAVSPITSDAASSKVAIARSRGCEGDRRHAVADGCVPHARDWGDLGEGAVGAVPRSAAVDMCSGREGALSLPYVDETFCPDREIRPRDERTSSRADSRTPFR